MIDVTTVHVLEGGRPLCGFMPGKVPGDWPARHKWVAIDDEANHKHVNCSLCFLKLPSSPLTASAERGLAPQRIEELNSMLKQMKNVSNGFYAAAVQIGCHPFIEFCGFMNEYIKLCENALVQGVDFALSSDHTGTPLPIRDFEAGYIGEKFACIFAPTFNANREAWEIFKARVWYHHG